MTPTDIGSILNLSDSRQALNGGIEMNEHNEYIAYSLGVTAFKNNLKRIPASDSDYLETCIKGLAVGEGIKFHKAWLKGWDFANLNN